MEEGNSKDSNEVSEDKAASDLIQVKVIGVGGAGNNTVDRLKLDNLGGVNLAAVNTDGQVLASSPISEKLMIGKPITRGLGAGGEIKIGRESAEADRDSIKKIVSGADLIFLIAGLGGGTGSGSTPIVAETAVEVGAVVIAFGTLPFTLEGSRRHRQAEDSLVSLRKICHAVIPLPNDILLQQADEDATVLEAFSLADEWITKGIRSICSMLFETGLINIDFSSLKKIFESRGGKTLFGMGKGSGDDFVGRAVDDLMICPLLHTPEFSKRADNLIVNLSGGTDLTMTKVNEILTIVAEKFGSKESTLIGATIDENLSASLSICVLGTTDIEGRGRYRPSKSLSSFKNRQSEAKNPELETEAQLKPVHRSKLIRKNNSVKREQEEFDFCREEEQRGYFETTDPNIYDGENLDVPAYLRRVIRIVLL